MNAEIPKIANQLLEVIGIERVVSIDDAYTEGASLQEVLAALDIADPPALIFVSTKLEIESTDVDTIKHLLRNKWGDLKVLEKQAIATELLPPEEHLAEGKAMINDLSIATNLPNIFGSCLEMLSLQTWNKRRKEWINETMPSTLLLVDLNFTDEGASTNEGINIIKSLLNETPKEKIFCALLTNLYPLDTIYESWKTVCEQHGLPQDRFVLIPKDTVSNNEKKFLTLIKMVVMNERADKLKKVVVDTFTNSLETAREEVSKIDIFEFEQIVFTESLREGVWESDTLVRLFSLFHNNLARKNLRTNQEVHKLTQELRNLSMVQIREWSKPSVLAEKIQRMEWYEDEEEVNAQLLPTELGDLYSIESKPGKVYVLAAQPCDLMVRYYDNGRRNHKACNAILLEASKVTKKGNDSGLYYDLEYYEAGADWRVDLRSVHYVCLDVLDLCALREDGKAEISQEMAIHPYLSAPWRARAELMIRESAKMLARYAEFTQKSMKAKVAAAVVTSATLGKLFSGMVDPATKTISYNLKRVGRLKQPRAGSLLSKYSNAMARDAFDHPLFRQDSPAAESKENSAEAILAAVEHQESASDSQTEVIPAKLSDAKDIELVATSVLEPDKSLTKANEKLPKRIGSRPEMDGQ